LAILADVSLNRTEAFACACGELVEALDPLRGLSKYVLFDLKCLHSRVANRGRIDPAAAPVLC
jgi:hypothetical protein